MAGENLDFASDAQPPHSDRRDGHRFLGIRFACCDVYTRIYLNRAQTAYEGRCPKCARPLHIRVGPGGTDARFFEAY